MADGAAEPQPLFEFGETGEGGGIGEDVGIRPVGTAAQRLEFTDPVVCLVVVRVPFRGSAQTPGSLSLGRTASGYVRHRARGP